MAATKQSGPRNPRTRATRMRTTPARDPAGAAGSKASVDACVAQLEPARRAAVDALRRAILAVDARIREEVKWNAPSFALDDHFATFRLNPAPAFQLILHTGAKRKNAVRRRDVPDPHGWVTWAAPDRAVVALPSTLGAAEQHAVIAMVRRWIEQL